MPRLSTSLIRGALSEHPYLPLLLRECRDLPSARNELRWLTEYLQEKGNHTLRERTQSVQSSRSNRELSWQTQRQRARSAPKSLPTLLQLCKERALGKPLQYILGSQPFGSLDILCEEKVLIPRWETEHWVLKLAQHIKQKHPQLLAATQSSDASFDIVDLGTGTGCIALLLHKELAPFCANLKILAVDKSKHALRLARMNLEHNVRCGNLLPRALSEISFEQNDILNYVTGSMTEAHVVVTNPPYITKREFKSGQVTKSVRQFEPRLALLSSAPEGKPLDYCPFFDAGRRIAERLSARVYVCELGNEEQFRLHSADVLAAKYWTETAVWTDNVSISGSTETRGLFSEPMFKSMKPGFTTTVYGNGDLRVLLAEKDT